MAKTKSKAKSIVDAVLNQMQDYSGFDGFWADCDKDTRKDIKKDLTDIVESELSNE